MQNYFDLWNTQKKEMLFTESGKAFYEREVWWAKLGINVGVEINGRHELFLRPVIVIRKFNKDMALVVPTTSQYKTNKYYFAVSGGKEKTYRVCLSQIKTISSKRLLRKINTIHKDDYQTLIDRISSMVKGDL